MLVHLLNDCVSQGVPQSFRTKFDSNQGQKAPSVIHQPCFLAVNL